MLFAFPVATVGRSTVDQKYSPRSRTAASRSGANPVAFLGCRTSFPILAYARMLARLVVGVKLSRDGAVREFGHAKERFETCLFWCMAVATVAETHCRAVAKLDVAFITADSTVHSWLILAWWLWVVSFVAVASWFYFTLIV